MVYKCGIAIGNKSPHACTPYLMNRAFHLPRLHQFMDVLSKTRTQTIDDHDLIQFDGFRTVCVSSGYLLGIGVE